MCLTFGFASPRDLFEKLERDAALLEDEVTRDRFFNFVLTGWSLVDWVKHCPTPPRQVDLDNLRAVPCLKVCGDLATASKHFKLTDRAPITDSATSSRGAYGTGRHGKGVYGVGEESIRVELNDGTTFDALGLTRQIVSTWRDFLASHGL
jgi:hypothetical protein